MIYIINSFENVKREWKLRDKKDDELNANNTNENRKYIVTGENKNILTKIGPNYYAGIVCKNKLDKSIEEHK